MESRSLPCPLCAEIREFVQPPCPDGHTDEGGECPEWACVDCGTAFVVGEVFLARAVSRARSAA